MDASEADRLTRDFAQYAKLKTDMDVQQPWAGGMILTMSALFTLVFASGIAIAFS